MMRAISKSHNHFRFGGQFGEGGFFEVVFQNHFGVEGFHCFFIGHHVHAPAFFANHREELFVHFAIGQIRRSFAECVSGGVVQHDAYFHLFPHTHAACQTHGLGSARVGAGISIDDDEHLALGLEVDLQFVGEGFHQINLVETDKAIGGGHHVVEQCEAAVQGVFAGDNFAPLAGIGAGKKAEAVAA